MLTSSSTSNRGLSQMPGAPKRSEGLTLPVPRSLACNLVFARGVKYPSIPVYGSEALPLEEADEKMLVVFDNDSIRRIFHMRCRDFVPTV